MPEHTNIEQHYLVEGMTCNHCVASVTEEVSELSGVESVTVDLRVGGASDVTVVSSAPVPLEGIRAAITEAGYLLVSA
ncbi:cation transporter [Frigoribacterium sp. UYMn621]|uniref:heavy-metal-associated domain-containing protein n=1 Tax=Frigoribacterium sp. UYMn621 TaxID=3156343 RepID=UPI0033976C33